MSAAQDDTGIHGLDNSTDSFADVHVVDEPEASPPSKHSEGGEDIVVLDDVSEPDKEDTPGFDDERHISTTSEDVLGGIAGEGAELHPEFDDFEDDQQFEVLETADGDLSEGQESSEVEQSPSGSSSATDKERSKNSGREKSSSEKSGDKSRSKESDSHSSRSRAKAGEGSTSGKGRRERSKERKPSSEAVSSSASPSGSSTGKKDEKEKRPISPIVFGSQKDSRDKEHDKSGSKSSRDKSKSNSGPHRIVDKIFSNTRYFVIKSNNYENVQIAKDRNVWSTPPYNEKKLNKAYKDCRNVILIFSVRESGRFQGIARLMTESRHDGHHVPWVLPPGISQSQLGGVFKLDWLHKGSLEFSVCMDLKNPWNDNKPVKISRDGQEVEPSVGEKLCRLWQKIESDDDVLSGRDQRAGPSGGTQTGSSSGSGSSSIPHSGGHMPHFPGRPGMLYPPVYPPYGYPPMSHHMFPGVHPGDARSRIPSHQPQFHPPRLELQSMSGGGPLHHPGSGSGVGSYRPARPWWTITPGAPPPAANHPPTHMPPFFPPPYPPPHYHHPPPPFHPPRNSNTHYGEVADNVPTFVPSSQYVPTSNPSPNQSSNPSSGVPTTNPLSSNSSNLLSSSTSTASGAHSSPPVHRQPARNAYSNQRATLIRQRQEQQRRQQQQQQQQQQGAEKKAQQQAAAASSDKKEESTRQLESSKKSQAPDNSGTLSQSAATGTNGERRLLLQHKRNDQLKSTSRSNNEKRAQSNSDKKASHNQQKQKVESKEEAKSISNEVSGSETENNKRPKSEASKPTSAKVANDEKVKAKKPESSEVNGSGGRGKKDEQEEAVVATTMAST